MNWKYIIGEILLIFVGINLAIWFNNWNTSRNANEQKVVAIDKIRDEVKSNLEELEFASEKNNAVLAAFSEFQHIYAETSSEVVAMPHELNALQKKYPDFFRISDSAEVGDGIYRYRGGTFVELELPELSEIAWETTRFTNIAREFEYDCLYNLESMYLLQRRVQKELDKAADALQQKELKRLVSVLNFKEQLSGQLLQNYKDVIETIEDCR